MSHYPDLPDKNLAPHGVIESLKRYRDHQIPTGGFLQAVLENDLKGAVGRADGENLPRIHHIVAWLYYEMPSDAWGSPDKVEQWLLR